MPTQRDSERIALQEQVLRFQQFDADIAWDIGNRLRTKALERQQAIVIDITLNHQLLFFCAMPKTAPDNAEWTRRKRNVVQRFHRSSYAIGLTLERQGTTLAEKYGVANVDFAAHGGCFPVFIQEAMVGTIAISGLPQRADHELIVEVLADSLGENYAGLKLD
ncbi:heme-degrading domain-containing protein [Thiolinea disciformis]|uniref:heme-degrading domain-containing protein n=1 Tax=Thiolinea disciformis TaxID=125614 RepID=UPI00037034D3|nr:heme-degrading domain-containing protein [Thiolinea disciformis]